MSSIVYIIHVGWWSNQQWTEKYLVDCVYSTIEAAEAAAIKLNETKWAGYKHTVEPLEVK